VLITLNIRENYKEINLEELEEILIVRVIKKEKEMIKAKDIDKMVRWAVDTDGFKFSEDIYQRENPDEYTRGKFRGMQTWFINWVANLDDEHKQKLADAINNNPTNEEGE